MSDILDDLVNSNEFEEEPKEVESKNDSPYTDEELKAAFGDVDKMFTSSTKSRISDIHFGSIPDPEDSDKFIKDENTIFVFFNYQDPFDASSEVEGHVKFSHVPESKDDKKLNELTDKKINYAFHNYGIKDWNDLYKIAKSNEDVRKKLLETIESKLQDKAIVTFYQGNFVINQNGSEVHRTFWSVINRRKGGFVGTYSKYYQENGGFPGYPTKQVFACAMNHSDNNTLVCKVLSINNNSRFKRFEVEVQPIKGKYPEFDNIKDSKGNPIYSFLCTYPYADKDNNINPTRRLRQSQSIAESLGAIDYTDSLSKIGTVVTVKLSAYDSSFTKGATVYRARMI